MTHIWTQSILKDKTRSKYFVTFDYLNFFYISMRCNIWESHSPFPDASLCHIWLWGKLVWCYNRSWMELCIRGLMTQLWHPMLLCRDTNQQTNQPTNQPTRSHLRQERFFIALLASWTNRTDIFQILPTFSDVFRYSTINCSMSGSGRYRLPSRGKRRKIVWCLSQPRFHTRTMFFAQR